MSQPNIIHIIFDDMCASQVQRMPQLMKLAKTGVLFSNCYTTTALCQPARKTLLTGQYTHNHGVVDNGTTGYATLDTTTLLNNILHQAGYKTCHVGKYDNQYTVGSAQPVGWDEWHSISPQNYFGFSINDNGATSTGGSGVNDYYTNVVNSRAAAFLNSTTEPFYMQIGFHCPHTDIQFGPRNATASPVYAGVTPTSVKAPRIPSYNTQMDKPPAYMVHTPMDQTTVDAVDAFWRGQIEMLYSADETIANLMAILNATGKTNTVIVVDADHGLYHGEETLPDEKVAPYIPALHIPLIISGPSGLVAQNKICSALVGNIDVAPTIYALSGTVSSRTMDGVSLVPFLNNPAANEVRGHLLLEWLGQAGDGWGVNVPVCQSILAKDKMYTKYITGEEELYDLSADPYQLTNQIGAMAYLPVQAQLTALLKSSANCVGANCVLN